METARLGDPVPPRAPGAAQASACRGVRGATTVGSDQGEGAAADAVSELLGRMLAENSASSQDLAAAIFTIQDDLLDFNPATAARSRGFTEVPLLAVREHAGDSLVPHCVRVLLLLNTTLAQHDIRHVYLREASSLRPDLASTEVPSQ